MDKDFYFGFFNNLKVGLFYEEFFLLLKEIFYLCDLIGLIVVEFVIE